MELGWTEAQQARRAEAVEFARRSLNEGLEERERAGEFSREAWRRCAEQGLLGLTVPKEFGGAGAGILTAVLTMEGLGYGCQDNGLLLGLSGQMWTVQYPLVRFGTDEQKRRYLPELCSGRSIGAHALSEPEAGSDAYSLMTEAVRTDDGYVLNGSKHLITFAPVADLFLLFATTRPGSGRWGITAFLVDRDTPGVTVTPAVDKMGLRTAPMAGLQLEDCRVPVEARLGSEGAGAALSTASLEYERSCMLASQLGTMERQIETVVEHASSRIQFGQAIGKFQSVSNRVADMKARLEASRYLVYRVAWLKSQDEPAVLEAAVAKLFLTESLVRSSEDALRIFGGKGYLTEAGVERELRDALAGITYGGTSDIQRQVIARLVGL